MFDAVYNGFCSYSRLFSCLIFRRMKDMEGQNRDLSQTVAKREEAIHQSNVRQPAKLFYSIYVNINFMRIL